MPVRRVTALALSSASLIAFHPTALAQEGLSDPTSAADTSEEEEEEEEEETEEPGTTVGDEPVERDTPLERETQAATTEAGRSVERWPATAYPEPQVRGLHGGSLWLNMHGLQWPYAPQTDDEPDTRFGLSGSVWIDTGLKVVDSTNSNALKETKWLQEGRFVLRGTPTYTQGDWFVQGQAELVASKDQAPVARVDADDVWVRAGHWNTFDVQVGRFEAWEIYHYGMGLDLYTLERRGAVLGSSSPADIYGATFLFERPASAGNVAAHVYATEFLRFELLGQLGNSSLNTLGVRPAAVLDLGWLKLKAGAEYVTQTYESELSQQENESRGAAGAIQFVVDPYVEFGLNGGYALVDNIDQAGNINREGSTTRASAGGFLNARVIPNLLLGVGGNYTKHWNIHEDDLGNVGEFDHIQAFGAVQYLLFEQLFIKGVFGWANAHFAPSFTDDVFENTMLSGRLRLMYLF